MTDILEEVLQDQSYEKKVYYFKKILPIVIFCTILTIVVMLVISRYNDKRIKHNMSMGDALLSSASHEMQRKNSVDKITAEQLLDQLIQTSDTRVSEIAVLRKLMLKIAANEYNDAKLLLEKIIDNESYYDNTRSFARIIWIDLAVNGISAFTQDKNRIEKYFEYFDDENKEFFGNATLLKALWYSKSGKSDIAKFALTKLLGINDMPQIIKEQARAMLANIER